jgi:hypothetical protein
MNEVAVYDDNVPAIADDSLLMIAQQAERRIDAVIKIKQIALKVTNPRDWTDQGGNPYLQVSGAEKIANLFNISWRIDEPICETEDDGHFTFTYTGTFSVSGRSIQVSGSRSSKDPFFKKYEWVNGVKTEKPISAIDRRDVKMAAMTNLLGNGITRLLGIRNLTYADLEAFAGIKADQIGKVEYKNKNAEKEPVKAPTPKAETKKAPVQPPQKKATAKEKTTEAEQIAIVKITSVASKTGEKDGKPYTVFTIFDEADVKYGTFSETFVGLARSAKESGELVKITFTVGTYGNKVTGLELAEKAAA